MSEQKVAESDLIPTMRETTFVGSLTIHLSVELGSGLLSLEQIQVI